MILNVNGSRHEVEAGTRTLLEILRDDLNLVGTKEGCGVGMCGACTVLVEGKPFSSCHLLAVQVAEKDILTIEGLSKDGNLHPVQKAYLEHAAFQCAYCTPGFVLTTIALLHENPSPSDNEIREYLSGNLCRCGSYQNILQAVKAVSVKVR
ncbi:MAG TPA: (2Fe-2S)-binding protein [Anaerolineales bacterium]|nr:(2Fe-2S)-binding protein [Anaerolineales bacterium]